MNEQLQSKLSSLLERDHAEIGRIWTQRLSKEAFVACMSLSHRVISPVDALLRDVRRGMEGHAPVGLLTSIEDEQVYTSQQLGLCRAAEVFQVGEAVVRHWVSRHLDAADAEKYQAFEMINRVFHKLIRLYTLHYCSQCHARLDPKKLTEATP